MDGANQVLLSREHVYIHPNTQEQNMDGHIPGRVTISRKPEGIFLEWKATEDLETSPPGLGSNGREAEWTMVPDSVTYKNSKSSHAPDSVTLKAARAGSQHQFIVNFDIKDLKSIRKSRLGLGYSFLIFILKCGTTYPALYFHRGGTKLVMSELRKHLTVQCSVQDSCLYLVREHDPQALSKSFDELQLFERDQAGDIITKFIQDPYSTAIGGFSKVTHFLRDALMAMDTGVGDTPTPVLPEALIAEAQQDLGLAIKTLGETGFEMVTTKVELPPRPSVTRCAPVNAQQWQALMDGEGRVRDIDAVKEAVFKGGVDPMIRTEVWKFLLGYYPWGSTTKSRMDQRKQKVDDYFRMKLQWKSISEDQESRFSDLRDRRSLIEKDVARTDRVHKFFEGENNPNIAILHDILLTHCMYDFDLGYVQGMSDLLAPILVVMENEVDAFWCFAGFIKMVGLNFEKDQSAMKNQLLQLQTLINFVDPELANYLESHDSINMYFCFRWLLIVFKREFSFPDIMRLWEVVWTGRPCQNFHLLLCLAILDSAKSTLIENNFGFTEILKHINDLSGTIDVESMLCKAESICVQLCACRDLPSVIHNILGLSTSPTHRPPFHSVPPSDLDLNDEPSGQSQRGSPERTSSSAREPVAAAAAAKEGEAAGGEAAGGARDSPTPSVGRRDAASPPSDDSSIEILSEQLDPFV